MLTEKNQVGKREALADLIARVDAKNTPTQAMIRKGGDITNMLSEWQLDDFESPDEVAVEDGVDAENFDNASPNRARVGMYAMKVRDTAMVSDLAENVSDVAGVEGHSEMAESIMKKLKKLARSIEAYICGDQDAQLGSPGTPYKFRGLGSWINNTAQTTLPVPANYLTPSASILTGATATQTTNANLNLMMSSIYSLTGQQGEFELIVGRTLKTALSGLTNVATASTNVMSIIRTYNTQFSGLINNVVDTFTGDFGTANIHLSLWNAFPHAAYGYTSPNDYSAFRGYLLNMKLLELSYKRKPRVKPLEDRGGGPRFLVDAILTMRNLQPQGHGALKYTS